MQLIGMLDSPYVRRVAISLLILGLRFEHRSISVFRGVDAFSAINPVVKAPTLVCDDGTVLIDSTLIIDYAQTVAGDHRLLMPAALGPRTRALRTIGLALLACDKSVQIIYEMTLRPAEKRHAPWLERVDNQLRITFELLEAIVADATSDAAASTGGMTLDQAMLSTAVAWHFVQQMLPGQLDAQCFPALRALSARAEALPEFRAAPHGDGICIAGLPVR